MNSCTSSLSSLDNRYTFLFLGINSFFISIVWSYNFLVGIHLLAFLLKTWIYLWNLFGTSLFASSSNFAVSSSSQIFYPSTTFLTSIILSTFGFFFFFLFLLFLFLLLFFLLFSFFFFLFFLLWFFLLWSPLLLTLFWEPCYFYFSCSLVDLRIVVCKPWHFQNYFLLLSSNHVNLHSLPVFLIIDIDLHY